MSAKIRERQGGLNLWRLEYQKGSGRKWLKKERENDSFEAVCPVLEFLGSGRG